MYYTIGNESLSSDQVNRQRIFLLKSDYISRFLLDRSDEVARELSHGGDARLLVRARRSLLLAAAELYSRTPHEST